MGRPYDFQYLRVPGSSTGTMKCSVCGKQIVEGDFRSYKRSKHHDWAYVTQHRECSSHDPEWGKRDAAKERYAARSERLRYDLSILALRYPEFNLADFIEEQDE